MRIKERAVFCREIPGGLAGGAAQVVYVGDEFCERRLPSPGALLKALEYCQAAGIRLCLATPCLTDDGTARLSALLEILSEARTPCDLVVNDWGALRLLGDRAPGLGVWLGRLISTRHFQVPPPGYPASPSGVGRFLAAIREQRVSGVEMNSVRTLAVHLQALAGSGFKTAIHTPYIFLTMTRCCPCVGADQWYYKDSLSGCGHECERYAGVVANPGSGEDLHIGGNALFLKRDLESLGPGLQIDRVIDNKALIPARLPA